jgi:hypothetical protein
MDGRLQLGEQPVELIATVASTIASQPSIIADELRRQADPFADLVEIEGPRSVAIGPPRPPRTASNALYAVESSQRLTHQVAARQSDHVAAL